MFIIFTSPDFAQSVTLSNHTPNWSLCSHHQNFHNQLLVLFTLRTTHYIHNTTVCTVSNLFYSKPKLLGMFKLPQFAHSVTCSFDTPNFSFYSYQHNLYSQLFVLMTRRNAHYVIIPQLEQSVTCSINTPKCPSCSQQKSLHCQLLALLILRTAQYIHINTVCTVS
jgi:hypothetical protein